MRLRIAKGVFCAAVVTVILGLSLFLIKQLHLTVSPSPPAPTLPQQLYTKVLRHPQDPSHLKDTPYLVPPKPDKGDGHSYPIPDGLRDRDVSGRQGEKGGRGGRGQSLSQEDILRMVAGVPVEDWADEHGTEQSERSPLKEANELWNLILPPKQALTADRKQDRRFSSCLPRHHIFFGKVHKTGSSTVANILQRYGFTRDLNFVLPRKPLGAMSYNYITMPGQTPSLFRLIPAPLGKHYDVLWSHAIYHRQFYHDLMPPDTVYVTILRHPLQQFVSAFEYYGHMPGGYLYTLLQRNVSNPLSVYLQDPSPYEGDRTLMSYVRNKQAQDLGMNNQHVINRTLRWEYLQELDRDFHLVMITEFFDESLVLLRRLMCWSVKDILYLPKNKNNLKKRRVFSPDDLQRHKELNVADFDLYEFFSKRFQRTMQQQGRDFTEEVTAFKRLLRRVQILCHTKYDTVHVRATRWNEAFIVVREDCHLMLKDELAFLNDIVLDAVRKFQQSAVQDKSS